MQSLCLHIVGAPDSGGRQFLIYFMENNVEAPRYLSLEVYVTPVRAPSVSVRIESPMWFEPHIGEDATVRLLSFCLSDRVTVMLTSFISFVILYYFLIDH